MITPLETRNGRHCGKSDVVNEASHNYNLAVTYPPDVVIKDKTKVKGKIDKHINSVNDADKGYKGLM